MELNRIEKGRYNIKLYKLASSFELVNVKLGFKLTKIETFDYPSINI